MATIFILKVNIIHFELDEKREEYLPLSYPFDVTEEIIGYFSSLEKAEIAIQNYLVFNNEQKYRNEIHSFTITEYVVDDKDNEYFYAPSQTRRTYLSNGKSEESCLVSEWRICGDTVDESCKFYGRKPEEIRFKKGDIVELMAGKHQVIPCIVVGTPRTVADVRKTNKKWGIKKGEIGWYGDYSDDHYYLIPYLYYGELVTLDDIVDPETSPYPLDIEANSFYIFPPTIPVPDDMKEKLQTFYLAFEVRRKRFLKQYKNSKK
jgi:hypothetical protein